MKSLKSISRQPTKSDGDHGDVIYSCVLGRLSTLPALYSGQTVQSVGQINESLSVSRVGLSVPGDNDQWGMTSIVGTS